MISSGGYGEKEWHKMKDEGRDIDERTWHRRGPIVGTKRNESGQAETKTDRASLNIRAYDWTCYYRELAISDTDARIQMLFWNASEQVMARCLNPSQGIHVENKCPAHWLSAESKPLAWRFLFLVELWITSNVYSSMKGSGEIISSCLNMKGK